MPSLFGLEIDSCHKLEMIPDGLKFILTLKELIIFNMPQEFNERIRLQDGKEGVDFDQIRHVPMLSILD